MVKAKNPAKAPSKAKATHGGEDIKISQRMQKYANIRKKC